MDSRRRFGEEPEPDIVHLPDYDVVEDIKAMKPGKTMVAQIYDLDYLEEEIAEIKRRAQEEGINIEIVVDEKHLNYTITRLE